MVRPCWLVWIALAMLSIGCSTKSTGTGVADAGPSIAPPTSDAAPVSTVGIPDAAGPANDAALATGDAATACVPPTTNVPACNDCMRVSCCELFVACDSDPACVEFQVCIDPCYKAASQEQFNQCATPCINKSGQASAQKYADASDCVVNQCGTACQGAQ